ncbi:MAG: hypothetical protein KC468_23695 [Myxococcales bacterium]|nr:hypothetical protein [Myxococcales bacterium]
MTESKQSAPERAAGTPAAKSKNVAVASQQRAGGEGEAEGEGENESRLGWFMGWIVGPGLVLGAIFTGGVLVGAHYHDGWIARAIMWIFGLFSG